MTLFGRELTIDQIIGLVETNAMPDDDLVHRAALELIAALRDAKRMADAAVDTLTKLLKHADDDICAYCKNQIKCNDKDCESYCEGVGDVDGNYMDWKWTCKDFDYGTCFKMQDTPCNGCFDNHYSGFEWRGPQAGEGERDG